MTKFTINPRVVYSGDTCYVTIAAFSHFTVYLLTWGLGHLRCLVYYDDDDV